VNNACFVGASTDRNLMRQFNFFDFSIILSG
jgi:hypothetical protein